MSTLLEDNIFTSNYFGRNAKSKEVATVWKGKRRKKKGREKVGIAKKRRFLKKETPKKKQWLDSWLKGDQMCFKLVWSPSTSCLGFKSHLFESLSLFVISYQTSKGPFEISVKGECTPKSANLFCQKIWSGGRSQLCGLRFRGWWQWWWLGLMACGWRWHRGSQEGRRRCPVMTRKITQA